MFWGWGGEDDDMSKRISHHKMKIIRYQNTIARYTMVKHKQEKANKMRQSYLSTSHKRWGGTILRIVDYSTIFVTGTILTDSILCRTLWLANI